jgi:hypothetical protein
MTMTLRCSVLAGLVACGTADDMTRTSPTYLSDIAPILQANCTRCHGAPLAIAQAQNCVRLDRWDSVADTQMLCTNTAMDGLIFGVHDADAMLVDQVAQGLMPFGGPMLDAADLDILERWRDAGFPRRSPNAPPTIQFTAPTGNITACNPTCTVSVSYVVADPDGDTVTWSLGWSGSGKTGTFATRLADGTGTVMIDASALGSGTYTLTATLDDGTAKVSTDASATLTIPAGHNAAPSVTVVSPNGGEWYYDTQPITVTWNGTDGDGASLSYDVVAVQGTTTSPIATELVKPVGIASMTWTLPQVAALTAYQIQVTAHDDGSPPLSAMDRSDATFLISPPPQQVSFSSQIQPILTANCTSASCHDATLPQQGLNLTAGAAYGSLVNVNSTEVTCASYKRVLPGQPDQSYVIFKLSGSGACFYGSQMPKAAPALSITQIQLFRDWIANGAPNN